MLIKYNCSLSCTLAHIAASRPEAIYPRERLSDTVMIQVSEVSKRTNDSLLIREKVKCLDELGKPFSLLQVDLLSCGEC